MFKHNPTYSAMATFFLVKYFTVDVIFLIKGINIIENVMVPKLAPINVTMPCVTMA